MHTEPSDAQQHAHLLVVWLGACPAWKLLIGCGWGPTLLSKQQAVVWCGEVNIRELLCLAPGRNPAGVEREPDPLRV
jgi:hypothetical protein